MMRDPFSSLLDVVDCVAVANADERTILEDRNGPNGIEILVTGTPRWDSVVRTGHETDAAKVRQELGIGVSEKLLVFASQPIASNDLTRMTQAWVESRDVMGIAGWAFGLIPVKKMIFTSAC
jgi:hypothetical protein